MPGLGLLLHLSRVFCVGHSQSAVSGVAFLLVCRQHGYPTRCALSRAPTAPLAVRCTPLRIACFIHARRSSERLVKSDLKGRETCFGAVDMTSDTTQFHGPVYRTQYGLLLPLLPKNSDFFSLTVV